jgi:hypothetical protein
VVRAEAAGQLRDCRGPVRRLPVIQALGGSQRFRTRDFFIAAGGHDDPRAEHPRELQGEDRDAAGSEHHDGVAPSDAACMRSGVPRRDRRAWQRRGLEGALVEHASPGEDAVRGGPS